MSKKLIILARFSEDDIRESYAFLLNKKKVLKEDQHKFEKCDTSYANEIQIFPYCIDVHAASYFVNELHRSSFFRRRVWNNHTSLSHTDAIVLQILLKEPIRYHMDQRLLVAIVPIVKLSLNCV